MRINQFISQSGYCSRREADVLIKDKRVKINGRIAQMGDSVELKDHVTVNGKVITKKKSMCIWCLTNRLASHVQQKGT